MNTRRPHAPKWGRRWRGWWFETPRAEIVRMVVLLALVVAVAAGLVLLVVVRG